MKTNLTNFFNYAAKEPQNTGGGSSQRYALRSEGARQRVSESETRGVNHAIITQLSRNNHPITHRAIRYVALLLMVFMVGIGQMWGGDFDVVLDQIRVLPTRSAFVKISAGSNTTVSSGALSIANNKTGTFTIESNIPTTYKIKSIAITVGRNVTNFTCTSGGTLSGENKSWIFTPTSNTPVGSASFSLNNTSGGTANMTFVVTMTTTETITIEELKTFTYSEPNFNFTSSVATSQVSITNKAGAGASSNYLNLSKSSNERSITIAAKTGYNLKLVSFYYYDISSDPTVTPSVATYTKATYTWIPSSTTTSADFSFDASGAGIKIWKIYVGYEASASCTEAPTAPTAFAKTDVTATTATFSITDAGDAASYDLYYASGTPSAPTGSTTATTNVSTKSPTIESLSGGTTYKIWVRSVCDADHKSDWVALGDGGSFTTLADPEATFSDGIYVLEGSALDLSSLFTHVGSGTVTYSITDAGGTSATLDGSSFSATAAGTASVQAVLTAAGGYAGATKTAKVRVVEAPTYLIENRMNVTSGSWDSYILTSNAHISNLKTIQASEGKTLIKSGKESPSGGRTPGITSNSSATLVEGDYIYIQFTVESGYELAVSEINVPVFKIASGDGKYVARISDASNDIESEELTLAQNGVGNPFNEYSFSSSPKLSGTVTLKLFAYGYSDGYRMESPVYIDGTITAAGGPTSYAITKSATNGTIATTVSSSAVTSAEESDQVDIVATPNTGFTFTSWDIYKTGESSTKVTPNASTASTYFTMPAYAVTVGATFTAINYTITKNSADHGTYTVKIGESEVSTANVGQTVTLAASPNSGYGFSGWTVMQGETPVSVTNNAFTMPAGNVTISASFAQEPNVYYYKSASHLDGSAYKNPEGNTAVIDDNQTLTTPWTICNACVTGVTKVEATAARYDGKGNHMNAYIKLRKDDSGKIVFTIASGYKATIKMKMGGYSGANTNITMKLNDSGDNIAYSGTMGGAGTTENGYAELTYANLAAGAYTLKPTSGSLYISQIDIQTTAIYTVTHTLTGVTTSSATKVDAGVAYNATYAAESGYTLPSTITVKVGGSTIEAENYTWNQATGALAIPAAQVTGNIQIIIAGEFTCPEAASGDVVFSWTPKTSLDNADIAAGTYDLPGEWLESVYGGSAEIYVDADEAMRIRNNQLAFNGNNAYVHLTICALAEGDRILVNSSNETNARNLWISLNATRPANAEAAAAVIEQGKAYYISSSSSLKNATDLYIWRASSTTQIGEVSIIRSKKFTVTYAASDLTSGAVPAAVSNIFDGQTITVAGQGTMEKGEMLFNGWKDANEVSYAAGDDLEVTANMTLTAQWSQLYTVTYAKAGTEEGAVPTQSSLLDGAEFTVADQGSLVTPANKEFGGWNDGTQTYAAGDTYTIDGANVTLTAVWNNSYTVQYDANGGTGTMSDGTGATVTIAANGFTYDGHKFLRWNTQQDGEGTNYAVGAEVSESLTLYAIWKEVTCTAGTNIFSIEFTNTANVNMADGDDDLDMSSYATIVGGSALMSYFRSGSNANVLTYSSSTSKASFGTNAQYLQLNLDCALQEGDVITIVNESGNKTAIASELAADKYPLNATKKENTSTTNTYTVLENDNIENTEVLYIGRNTGSGTLTFTAITIYRPLPDAPVPTIDENTPADANYDAGATISAMTVSADVEGAKALHYQWYKEAGETDIEVGTDAASYTPVASGDYYCVVTNSPTGYAPQSATSRTATITMISSDATLAWLKADGNDIALSDGVYAYEYVIDDDATVAPTITAGENEENATVTITQADSKTGTATIHVVAQDGETSHDYTVKFNEFSGCLTAFYFPYATDAENNHVTNNEALRGHTVFTTTQTNSSSYTGTLTVGADEYPVTKSTGSAADFGNLVVPEKYTATLYLLFRTGGSNCSVQLAKTGETPTPYMTSNAYASQGVYQYNFENVQAGTYVIRVVKSNGDVQNSNYLAMAAELCRYEVSSVSLANMTLRTGETAKPEMTVTPVKGAVVSQAWSFVDASTATAAGLSINATTGAVTATDEATPGAYTVKVVLNGDNALSATCTVTVITEYSQVDVTGTTEWDFATGKAASARIDIGYGDKLLANVPGVTNDETFNSQALMVDANYVSNAQLQSNSVMFHATVPGLLTIRYACTSGKSSDRVLYINDRETTSKTKATDVIEYTQVVPAGDVTIKAIFDDGGTPTVDIMNYKYIKFDADLDPTKAEESTLGGNERTVNPQYFGTICLPKAGVMTGATLFQVAYMDYKEDGVTPYKVYYDEVENGTMQAGMPYIFLAEQSTIGVYYTGTAEETAKDHNGLHGTLVRMDDMSGTGIYMLYQNKVLHSNSSESYLNANRAYIQISEIPGYNEPNYEAPAPRSRRIATGFNGTNTATGIDATNASEKPMKIMIDGQIFILRGEKLYDATGRLVK